MLPICILTIEDERDREFMAGVYTQYQWLMYDTIKQVMGDHWSAEDVVQTTLVRLIDKLEKLKTLDERHMVTTPGWNRQFDRARPTPLPLKSYTLSASPTPSV